MENEKRQSHETQARRYLENIGDRYVFNQSSGLYETQTGEAQARSENATQNVNRNTPLRVRVLTDWLVLCVSVATLLLLGLTVRYTRRQWLQTNRSANAAEIAAQAAKSAAATASDTLTNQQKSFEIDQRPYMVVDGPPAFSGNGLVTNKEITANITFKNIGRTPAFGYRTSSSLFRFAGTKGDKGRKLVKSAMQKAFDKLEREDATGRAESEKVGAEADAAPNASVFITAPNFGDSPVIISDDDLKNLPTGKISIFYVGVISYTDSFRNWYRTEFCEVYFGSDPKIWHICDNHNTIK